MRHQKVPQLGDIITEERAVIKEKTLNFMETSLQCIKNGDGE